MRRISVRDVGSYDVCIERGLLSALGEAVRDVTDGRRAAVVTDPAVAERWGQAALASLEAAGIEGVLLPIPGGEKCKCPETYLSLLARLADQGLCREDAVIALGGGVTGDLAGFAAATYLRGVPYLSVPTTLLAMVDSSVGGKCGIDLPEGKNLCGTFYAPRAVLIDPDLLSTLPAGELSNGWAEVVKYALLAAPELADADTADEDLIARCLSLKADLVARDPRDVGDRRLLNLGHTFGHAMEKLSGYALPHGRAVAAGMALMCRACTRMGICGGEVYPLLRDALLRHGLSVGCPYEAKDLAEAARGDKKRAGDLITPVVIRSFGQCALNTMRVEKLFDYALLGAEEL